MVDNFGSVKYNYSFERGRVKKSLSVIGYINHMNSPEVWAQNTKNHQIDSGPVPAARQQEIPPKI